MSRSCSCFGRLVMLALLMGLIFTLGSGLYRSGFRQGFVQGAVMAATDGQAAVPPAVYGHPGGFGGPSILGFGFVAFFALMFLFGRGHRRHSGHAGGEWQHSRRPPHKPDHGIGPEKQPEDFV